MPPVYWCSRERYGGEIYLATGVNCSANDDYGGVIFLTLGNLFNSLGSPLNPIITRLGSFLYFF